MGNLPGVVGWGGGSRNYQNRIGEGMAWMFYKIQSGFIDCTQQCGQIQQCTGKNWKGISCVFSSSPSLPLPFSFSPQDDFWGHSSSTFLWQSFSLFWSLPSRLSQPPWSLSDWFVCLSLYLCLKYKHESRQPVVLHAGFRDRAQFLILGRHTLHWLGCFTMNSFLISQRKSPWLGSSSILVWSSQNTRTVSPPSLYPACAYHHLHTTLCAMVNAI